jgi:D-alanyl-D-alanine carboxypeptidase
LSAAAAAAAISAALLTACGTQAPGRTPTTGARAATTFPAAPSPTSSTTASAYSLTAPASVWVVVDKLRPLAPKTYVPPDLVVVPVRHTNPPELRRVAATALVSMFAASGRAALPLASNSAYRSFATQTTVYAQDLHAHGRAAADGLTARPGYSEHQTGLAIDIGPASGRCALSACFAGTPEGKWLAVNAWRYGFILRYPKGLTAITGYDFEPWHYRFVGRPLAARMHALRTPTLEQYFGLGAAPSYRQ